jgi:L-galactose dehydrogenase
MQTRPLGGTGTDVPVLSFGTAPLGGLFGPVDEPDAVRLVHEAIDLGLTFIDTSPYYGTAEARLGRALDGRRDQVLLGTKAGRYGYDEFDFSPRRLRASLEQSLRLLGTDHVDILQRHDIEFVPLERVFTDSLPELQRLRDEGKCRFIGMTGYPLATMRRVVAETGVDLVLTYAHGTLLDDSLSEDLAPLAREHSVGLVNAAAVALGLLTPGGSGITAGAHPATPALRAAADAMRALCAEAGADLAFLANQYSIQRTDCATTVIGTRSSAHLRSAAEAATAPIDEELLTAVLALRPAQGERAWTSGLPENNLPENNLPENS